ncbi:hypothetical protein ACFSO7_07975 [Bacillus sp. CGMCC 1.16607]|uniref:hypothetical protein n=1 Tax=Bacillus sp. CGMCC 1.16607 TaxID=3351842 RepID=UPI0036419F69
MSNKFIVRFYFSEKEFIQLPMKAANYQIISDKIISAFKGDKWISFPSKEGLRKIDCTTIFLEKIMYFQIEKPTKVLLEKYSEEDYITW